MKILHHFQKQPNTRFVYDVDYGEGRPEQINDGYVGMEVVKEDGKEFWRCRECGAGLGLFSAPYEHDCRKKSKK